MNFLVFASLKKNIRITSRNQKIVYTDLYLNSRELWFSQDESSIKITISKYIHSSYVDSFW